MHTGIHFAALSTFQGGLIRLREATLPFGQLPFFRPNKAPGGHQVARRQRGKCCQTRINSDLLSSSGPRRRLDALAREALAREAHAPLAVLLRWTVAVFCVLSSGRWSAIFTGRQS